MVVEVVRLYIPLPKTFFAMINDLIIFMNLYFIILAGYYIIWKWNILLIDRIRLTQWEQVGGLTFLPCAQTIWVITIMA